MWWGRCVYIRSSTGAKIGTPTQPRILRLGSGGERRSRGLEMQMMGQISSGIFRGGDSHTRTRQPPSVYRTVTLWRPWRLANSIVYLGRCQHNGLRISDLAPNNAPSLVVTPPRSYLTTPATPNARHTRRMAQLENAARDQLASQIGKADGEKPAAATSSTNGAAQHLSPAVTPSQQSAGVPLVPLLEETLAEPPADASLAAPSSPPAPAAAAPGAVADNSLAVSRGAPLETGPLDTALRLLAVALLGIPTGNPDADDAYFANDKGTCATGCRPRIAISSIAWTARITSRRPLRLYVRCPPGDRSAYRFDHVGRLNTIVDAAITDDQMGNFFTMLSKELGGEASAVAALLTQLRELPQPARATSPPGRALQSRAPSLCRLVALSAALLSVRPDATRQQLGADVAACAASGALLLAALQDGGGGGGCDDLTPTVPCLPALQRACVALLYACASDKEVRQISALASLPLLRKASLAPPCPLVSVLSSAQAVATCRAIDALAPKGYATAQYADVTFVFTHMLVVLTAVVAAMWLPELLGANLPALLAPLRLSSLTGTNGTLARASASSMLAATLLAVGGFWAYLRFTLRPLRVRAGAVHYFLCSDAPIADSIVEAAAVVMTAAAERERVRVASRAAASDAGLDAGEEEGEAGEGAVSDGDGNGGVSPAISADDTRGGEGEGETGPSALSLLDDVDDSLEPAATSDLGSDDAAEAEDGGPPAIVPSFDADGQVVNDGRVLATDADGQYVLLSREDAIALLGPEEAAALAKHTAILLSSVLEREQLQQLEQRTSTAGATDFTEGSGDMDIAASRAEDSGVDGRAEDAPPPPAPPTRSRAHTFSGGDGARGYDRPAVYSENFVASDGDGAVHGLSSATGASAVASAAPDTAVSGVIEMSAHRPRGGTAAAALAPPPPLRRGVPQRSTVASGGDSGSRGSGSEDHSRSPMPSVTAPPLPEEAAAAAAPIGSRRGGGGGGSADSGAPRTHSSSSSSSSSSFVTPSTAPALLQPPDLSPTSPSTPGRTSRLLLPPAPLMPNAHPPSPTPSALSTGRGARGLLASLPPLRVGGGGGGSPELAAAAARATSISPPLIVEARPCDVMDRVSEEESLAAASAAAAATIIVSPSHTAAAAAPSPSAILPARLPPSSLLSASPSGSVASSGAAAAASGAGASSNSGEADGWAAEARDLAVSIGVPPARAAEMLAALASATELLRVVNAAAALLLEDTLALLAAQDPPAPPPTPEELRGLAEETTEIALGDAIATERPQAATLVCLYELYQACVAAGQVDIGQSIADRLIFLGSVISMGMERDVAAADRAEAAAALAAADAATAAAAVGFGGGGEGADRIDAAAAYLESMQQPATPPHDALPGAAAGGSLGGGDDDVMLGESALHSVEDSLQLPAASLSGAHGPPPRSRGGTDSCEPYGRPSSSPSTAAVDTAPAAVVGAAFSRGTGGAAAAPDEAIQLLRGAGRGGGGAPSSSRSTTLTGEEAGSVATTVASAAVTV